MPQNVLSTEQNVVWKVVNTEHFNHDSLCEKNMKPETLRFVFQSYLARKDSLQELKSRIA